MYVQEGKRKSSRERQSKRGCDGEFVGMRERKRDREIER